MPTNQTPPSPKTDPLTSLWHETLEFVKSVVSSFPSGRLGTVSKMLVIVAVLLTLICLFAIHKNYPQDFVFHVVLCIAGITVLIALIIYLRPSPDESLALAQQIRIEQINPHAIA